MKNTNSFAKSVKEEIVSKTYNHDSLIAILSSFTRLNGSLIIHKNKESILLKIENPKIAKFIYSSFQELFNEKPKIEYLKKKNFSKNTCYFIILSDSNLINKLHIHLLDNEIDKYFTCNSNRIIGYLTGSFLANGSVNSPLTSNYHLETSFNELENAKSYINLVKKFKSTNFDFKVSKRRKKYITYLKRSDQITDFLILIEAKNAALFFVDSIADRDLTSNANRLKNLDTANYRKTIKAANNDIKIINRLIKKKGFAKLGSEKAVLLASLRIKYPEDTLEELANKMSEELKEVITKSNINHLLRAFRLEGRNL